VAQTLAELTLKLSRTLERIELRCRRERELAEAERDRLLLAGPGKTILKRYHRGLEKAKQTQLETTDKADDARRREVLAAEDKRRRDLVREERRHRQTQQKAFRRKRESERQARRKWRDAVVAAKKSPLSQQRRLRKSADEALEKTLEEARDQYNQAVEDARLDFRAALQDELVDERLAVEAAQRKAQRLITGAAVAFERAVAQEETRMRSDLVDHPEAREAQESHDRKTVELRESCEREKDAAFRAFTRERRQLNKPRRAKK